MIEVAKMYIDNSTIPVRLLLNFSPQDEQAIVFYLKCKDK